MIENEAEVIVTPTHPFPVIRQVSAKQLLQWLSLGLQDTKKAGLASLFYGVIFSVGGWLIYFVFSHAFGLFAGLTTGFLLLGPFLAMGLYDLSKQIELNQPPKLIPSLFAWQTNVVNIGLFAGLLLIVLLVWARASLVIFALFFEGGLPTFTDIVLSVLSFKQPTFTTIYFAVGGLFAGFVFAISAIAVPLMADKKTDAVTAGIASVIACARNPLPMLLWAIAIVILVGIGFATSFLGLIITMPIVGHATWHVYRDLVE